MNAVEVFEDIKAVGERIASNDEQRFPEAASAGDFFRQGDIYITLHERVPEGAEPCSVALQLAPGTTKGSRHVLSHNRLSMYTLPGADALSGPVFQCTEEVTVTHPEHGDVVCPPGIYHVTYQRAFADEVRRVAD